MAATVSIFRPALNESDDDDFLQWVALIETPDGGHEIKAWSHAELVARIEDWARKRGLRSPNHTLALEAWA